MAGFPNRKKEDQKELWRKPKRESRGPGSKEVMLPQGRQTSSTTSLGIGQRQAPQRSSTYSVGRRTNEGTGQWGL